MRILQVTPYFPPAWAYGGPPRVIYELSRELARRHSITVLTTDAVDSRRRARAPQETLDGMEIHRLPNLSNSLAWRQVFLPIGVSAFLRRRSRDFDILHLHTLRTVQNAVAHRHALRHSIPYVLSAHGSVTRIVRQRTLKAIFDQVAGEALVHDSRRLIAQSNVEKLEYESVGVPSTKVSVIPHGIDPTVYADLPPRGARRKSLGLQGKRVILYLGRLSPGKSLDDLFAAFKRITQSRDDCVLLVAGPDDGYKDRLVKLARRLAISDRVRFLGFVPPPERLQLFVDSDVIAYPAAHESFGLVPIEALLCGRAVVVARESGCGELIERARAGITFPHGDVSLLSDALLTILADDTARTEMVRRGQAFILRELSWKRIATEMEQVYETAIADPN